MKLGELKQIVARAEAGEATLHDVVAILAAMFESSSKSQNEMKTLLQNIEQRLQNIEERVIFIEENTLSPIYRAVLEDEIDEEEMIVSDEDETADPD